MLEAPTMSEKETHQLILEHHLGMIKRLDKLEALIREILANTPKRLS